MKKKTLSDIARKFKSDMQKTANKDGVTISISSPSFKNGKEIIIAEPCNHKKSKLGYVAHLKYLDERYKKGDEQKQCPKCKKWYFDDEM